MENQKLKYRLLNSEKSNQHQTKVMKSIVNGMREIRKAELETEEEFAVEGSKVD